MPVEIRELRIKVHVEEKPRDFEASEGRNPLLSGNKEHFLGAGAEGKGLELLRKEEQRQQD